MLLALLPACQHDESAFYRRLQPITLYAGGIAITRAGFRDRAWNVPCGFHATGDGKRRCLPEAPTDQGLQFLDATCRQPVTTSAPGPGLDAFTTVTFGDGCDGTVEAYRRDSSTRMAATFLRHDGDCIPNPAGPLPVHPLQPITSEAVAGERVVGEAREGLVPILFVAEHVVLWHDGWHAQAQDADCSFDFEDPPGYRLRTGTPLRCWPSDVLSFGPPTFADSGCNLAAIPDESPRCSPPHRFGVTVDNTRQCPRIRHAFALRGSVPAAFDRVGGSCQLRQPPARAFVLGDEIPSEQWPAGELVIPAGPGRIRAAEIATAAGNEGTGYLWDDTLAAFCDATPMADGHTRCVPEEVAFLDNVAFADAGCTQPLAVASPPETGCAAFFAAASDATGMVTHLFRLGARHVGAVFMRNDSGACVQRVGPRAGGRAEFDLGAEIALDTLAEVRTAQP